MTLPSTGKKYQEHTTYKKTVLSNGVRIITEEIPYVQSVSLGIWVRSGSRYEQPEVNGICHFIEHMLFKGTDKRSAFDIAKEIDSVGGVLNAFTSKELTSFYCRVLHENLDLSVDLLSDIYLNSVFPEDEIEREKQVVCQEIHQLEDSPEDLVHEILGVRFWKDDPLGRPILGTLPSVAGLDRKIMMDFKREYYTPGETVVCAAGKVEHDRFVDLMGKQMDALPKSDFRPSHIRAVCEPGAHIENRDLEQVHLCIGMEGPSATADSRHAAYIINTILGGGMSSRLFQEIREKRGLAYSVYSYLSSFSDTGIFGLYAGFDPDCLDEVLDIMGRETGNLHRTITEEEAATAKNQIKGNIILAMESTDSRMNRLAKSEFYFDRQVELNEIIELLENVSIEELRATARHMIDAGNFTVVALGPVPTDADLTSPFTDC